MAAYWSHYQTTSEEKTNASNSHFGTIDPESEALAPVQGGSSLAYNLADLGWSVQSIAKPAASIMSPSKTRSGSFRDMQVDDRNYSVSLLDPELQNEPN